MVEQSSKQSEQRTQPWKAFWTPVASATIEKAGQDIPQGFFEKGQMVIISDSGGFTPKTYTQLYAADAAANTTNINQGVHVEKDESGKSFARFISENLDDTEQKALN